jgi:hypothetical protein
MTMRLAPGDTNLTSPSSRQVEFWPLAHSSLLGGHQHDGDRWKRSPSQSANEPADVRTGYAFGSVSLRSSVDVNSFPKLSRSRNKLRRLMPRL